MIAGADLGAVFDAHVGAEFELKDIDATMHTMVAEPSSGTCQHSLASDRRRGGTTFLLDAVHRSRPPPMQCWTAVARRSLRTA